MYRTVETEIYDDPAVKVLPPEAKFMLLYLRTNRHTHLSGMYYIPPALIAVETGLKIKVVETLCDTLSTAGLITRDRDRDLICVAGMFERQGSGEKNFRAAANHLRTLHNSPLIKKFLEVYPEVRKYFLDTLSNTLSETPSAVGIQEQEQKQEQDVKHKPRARRAGIAPGETGFDLFWKAYPKKVGKAAADKAWRKLNPSAEQHGEIMAGLCRLHDSRQWQREDGQFIPNPATFLNGARWQDQPEPELPRRAPTPAPEKCIVCGFPKLLHEMLARLGSEEFEKRGHPSEVCEEFRPTMRAAEAANSPGPPQEVAR